MTMMGEYSASILMNIIIELFQHIFLNAIRTLCNHIHSHSLATDGTTRTSVESKEDDKEWNIGEVQQFFG